ncbi:hypothetical protein [Streptomyces sp. 184]|uniref:hypothetical protein n=1 Tax=Streptomyces sp. 184 TaxID=1827526 RepID=UPI0038929782
MYGPPEPRPSSPALRIVLRLVLTAVPVVSLGLLAWVPMLRLAILRRTRRDWVLFWASAAVSFGAVGMLVTVDDQKLPAWRENTGGVLLILLIVTVAPWFLRADIRHHREATGRQFGAGGPGAGGPVPPYAHPGGPVGPPPYAQGTRPHGQDASPHPPGALPPQPPPPHGPSQPPQPSQPSQQPQPRAPEAPRAAQVRAELDELSDLLRREQEGGR